ncbi:MAG: aldose epimerase family protein [Candidatus Neomarinimicrobiota bacterium]
MKKIYFLLFSLIIVSCENILKKNKDMSLVSIEKKAFGKTKEGINVDQYILKNRNGMEISTINYGGIITSWKTKDRDGNYQDIVLGFDNLSEYESESPYFGAIIGRYGNRIAKGKFTLNDENYNLAVNNDENHLHGGIKGFDKVVWDTREVVDDSTASLVLSYLSDDMEEGYPGNLKVQVTYTLDNNDKLSVKYEAVTDKITIINLTQHSYFNLSADFNKNILDHDILINADSFLPVDSTLIPTGEIRNVGDTPFDFRSPKNVGEEINNSNKQLMIGNGYDHCWVLNNQDQGVRFVASAYDSSTGRLLEVFSDQPGIQFYSGNFLDGSLKSKIGGTYDFRSGFCLETQHYPNSPNEMSFPSVTLNPGEKYMTETIFKFSSK